MLDGLSGDIAYDGMAAMQETTPEKHSGPPRTARRRLIKAVCAIVVGMPLMALLFVNLDDYRRYTYITNIQKYLTEEQLEAMADAAKEVKGERYYRLEYVPPHIPEPFSVMHPIKVKMTPGLTDVDLYTSDIPSDGFHHYPYAVMRIDTTDENQMICVFHDLDGNQRNRRLWVRDKEKWAQAYPVGRLVSIGVWSLHSFLEWIVLENRLLIIFRPSTVGSDDHVLADIPLTESDIAMVKQALVTIPPSKRGKAHHDPNVMDGVHYRVCFSGTGEDDGSEILLQNAWSDDVGLLFDCIDTLAPEEYRLNHKLYLNDKEYILERKWGWVTEDVSEFEKYPLPEVPWYLIWWRFRR